MEEEEGGKEKEGRERELKRKGEEGGKFKRGKEEGRERGTEGERVEEKGRGGREI